jgi:phosphate transport system substrate-binding protein
MIDSLRQAAPRGTPRHVALLVAVLCGAPSPATAEELIRITGTGTAIGTMLRLGPAFERSHPGHRVKVLPSLGSAGAVQAVAKGAIEVGLAGRALRPDEVSLGLVALEVARTPFLFAVGPRAGATRLGAAELARIYRGEVTSWPGGERIRLVLRPRSDADTLFVRALSPELAVAMDLALARPGMLMAATNQECDAMLAHTPGGLGPSTLAQLRTEPVGLVPLAWEGVEPTLANLVSGAYPLAKPTWVVVRRDPPAAVRRFLAFLASPEGRGLLEAAGHQPLPFPPVE